MRFLRLIGGATVAVATLAFAAQAQEPIRLAYVDPLSGPMAAIGDHGLKHLQYLTEKVNAAGGVLGRPIEIVAYDGKLNPQESLVQVQKAIDEGIRFVIQGNGSLVAAAISDFADKHNERNPDSRFLYINYASVDPSLTNDKCTFWHFRWDAHSDVKMAALTDYIAGQPDIRKVYLINQDYSFGKSVQAAANAMLAEKRSDIEIVGDELHPLAKITDFSPYVAKIKASVADSVITGNWGTDISLLFKAAADAGLSVNWYTYYAGGAGGPTAIRQTRLEHEVFAIAEGFANVPHGPAQAEEEAFRTRFDGLGIWYPRMFNMFAMLTAAIEETGGDDPVAVGAALEGMEIGTHNGGTGYMRAEDHQFFQDMYLASFGPLAEDERWDEEKTGWGWHVVAEIPSERTLVPTTCDMWRP